MFAVNVDKNMMTVCRTEPVTSGSSKVYLVKFHFSPEWDDLNKIAVFRCDKMVRDVLLDEDICFIPWEVLIFPRRTLDLGVYGTMGGDVVLPTIWTNLTTILEGVQTGIEARPPTPTLYQQILDRLSKLESELKPITAERLEELLS